MAAGLKFLMITITEGPIFKAAPGATKSQFNLLQPIPQAESAGEALHKVTETSVQSVLCSNGQYANISGHTALKMKH